MTAPILLAFACVASGILAGLWLHAPDWTLWAVCFCAALSLRARHSVPCVFAPLLFLFLLGLHLVQQQNEGYDSVSLRSFVKQNEMETFRVEGEVVQTPELSADFWSFRLQVRRIAGAPVRGTIRVTVTGTADQYPHAGDQVETYIRLRLPSNYGAEGSFDYERYLRKERVHALGTVKNGRLIHVVKNGSGMRSLFSRIRLNAILRLEKDFSARDSAVLRALWLDDRAGLSARTERALINAGVFHVIAISGFHVAVLLGIGFLLLKPILPYRWALLVLCIVLVFYFLLLEGRSSITRSFLLFLSFSYASLRYEKLPWRNAIGLAALIQVALNPLELLDAGFHLTYLSTASIVFLAGPLSAAVRLKRSAYRYAFSFALTTFCVQLVLTPYLAWTFHRIPWGATLANWVAVPASSVLIAASLLYLPLGTVLWWLKIPIQWFVVLLINGSELLSGTWLRTGMAPAGALVVAFYLLLTCALLLRRNRVRIVAGVLCISCLIATLAVPSHTIGFFRIHVIDVGQGDAILLEYPDGTFDLVDGGGFWNTEALDIGESVVLPYFAHFGVTRLHRVFLTHAHADHMNGLFTVLRYIPVDELYVTRRPLADAGFQRLSVEWLRDLRTIHAGAVFQQGDVRVEVVSPDDSRPELHVANDDSLVMMVEYLGRRILLTGDMEHEIEQKLATRDWPRVDVMKVPHHGSRTSSTEALIAALRPKTALISVGRNNWFGHPHPEIVQRYLNHHVMLYRTDRQGTLRVTIKAGEITTDCYSWR